MNDEYKQSILKYLRDYQDGLNTYGDYEKAAVYHALDKIISDIEADKIEV